MLLPARCYFFELNHARVNLAPAIFCRHGGDTSTSTAEAFIDAAAGARRLLFIKWSVPGDLKVTSGIVFSSEMELSSTLLRILGGDAMRAPAIGGGGIQGPDRVFFFSPRVLSVNLEGLSSNIWFLWARDVQGPLCNFYLPRME
jgi:hypothetical protein